MPKITVLLFALIFASSIHANNPVATEELKVLATNFYQISELKGTTPKGLAFDLLALLSKKLNFKYKVSFIPWKRAQTMMEKSESDILIGPYYSEERAKFLNYVNVPIYTDWMVFYHLKTDPFKWDRNFKSLQNKNILLVGGWIYGQNFKEAEKYLSISEVPTIEQAFMMLENKRIALIAVNERNATGALLGMKNAFLFSKINTPIDFMQGYFAFSKNPKNETLRKKIEDELKKMQLNGELKKLSQKYALKYDPK